MSIFMYTVYTDLLLHRSQLDKETFEQMAKTAQERDQKLRSELQNIEFPIPENAPQQDVSRIMSLLMQLSRHHAMLNFLLEKKGKNQNTYSVITNGIMNNYSTKQGAYDSILSSKHV